MKRILSLLFLLQGFAAAAVILTLSPSSQSTAPGGLSNPNCVNGSLMCLTFSGTITPDASIDYFLNDLQLSFSPATAGLVHNSNLFFSSVPGFLASTDPAYTGFIFEVDVAGNIAPGLYHGTAVLLGGSAGPGDLGALSTATFDINITGVPEPGAASFVALGLVALALLRRFPMAAYAERIRHHYLLHAIDHCTARSGVARRA